MQSIVKGVPRILNVNREPSRPKRRKKVTLTFDETKRAEFLSGFRKRKIERRAKAKVALTEKLKAEKKRIMQQARAKFKTQLSQRDIPELEELLSKHEYEAEGKTVSILELNVTDLKQSANWIGENKPCYETDKSESEDDNTDNNDEIIPGMELKEKKVKSLRNDDNEQSQLSKREITRAIQKETLQKTHKSKLFKMKQRLESGKNKKMIERQKKLKERAIKKARGKTKRKLVRQVK